jgi:hypothetical protein
MTFIRTTSEIIRSEDKGPCTEPDGIIRCDTVTVHRGANRYRDERVVTFHHYRFSSGNDVRIVTPEGELVIDPADLQEFMAEWMRWRLESQVRQMTTAQLLDHGGVV